MKCPQEQAQNQAHWPPERGLPGPRSCRAWCACDPAARRPSQSMAWWGFERSRVKTTGKPVTREVLRFPRALRPSGFLRGPGMASPPPGLLQDKSVTTNQLKPTGPAHLSGWRCLFWVGPGGGGRNTPGGWPCPKGAHMVLAGPGVHEPRQHASALHLVLWRGLGVWFLWNYLAFLWNLDTFPSTDIINT